jgi:hypothetical protein
MGKGRCHKIVYMERIVANDLTIRFFNSTHSLIAGHKQFNCSVKSLIPPSHPIRHSSSSLICLPWPTLFLHILIPPSTVSHKNLFVNSWLFRPAFVRIALRLSRCLFIIHLRRFYLVFFTEIGPGSRRTRRFAFCSLFAWSSDGVFVGLEKFEK